MHQVCLWKQHELLTGLLLLDASLNSFVDVLDGKEV